MLSCREMSELGSEIIDRRLSWRTRLSVLLHTRKCLYCGRYLRQLKLTTEALQRLPLDGEPVDTAAILALAQQRGAVPRR